MGDGTGQILTRRTAVALVVSGAVFAGVATALAAKPAFIPDVTVIRGEINSIERDLLQNKESQASAASQLKKIRRLLFLQQKELQLSRVKVKELMGSLETLSAQKTELIKSVNEQKTSLKKKLRELNKLTESEALDAGWLRSLDAENQKSYFLAKTLKKELAAVESLKRDVQAALALELKIIEEKNKVDYYVQELEGQAVILTANEEVQRELLRTNRSNRFEAMRRMRVLKESERELEEMIAKFPEKSGASRSAGTDARGEVDVTLAAFKGKLPYPADGRVLSAFGKSFNPKTNLLTFQKGITLGAPAAAEVRAIAAGKVAYSGPLKNYGLIVILEHPGQYYTLYGQLGSVNAELGKAIAQGDPLGNTTGEPLYFEIRDKNVAINPLQWLANGSITLSKH